MKKYGSIHLNLKYWGDNKFPFLVKSKSSLLGERSAVQSLLKHRLSHQRKNGYVGKLCFLCAFVISLGFGTTWSLFFFCVGGWGEWWGVLLPLAILSFSYDKKLFFLVIQNSHLYVNLLTKARSWNFKLLHALLDDKGKQLHPFQIFS